MGISNIIRVRAMMTGALLFFNLWLLSPLQAQTAKSVLDKAAATVTMKDGVKADFKMTGSMGSKPREGMLQGENSLNNLLASLR